MSKIFIALSLALLAWQNGMAQSVSPYVVASTGGFFSNASGMLSETVGELAAVTTLSSANNFLTQGFQQPSDFNTGLTTVTSTDFSFLVFPNPGEGFFNIIIDADRNESLAVSVYDMIGKIITHAKYFITTGRNQFRIDLSQHSPGIYLLECSITNHENGEQSRTQIKLNLSY